MSEVSKLIFKENEKNDNIIV